MKAMILLCSLAVIPISAPADMSGGKYRLESREQRASRQGDRVEARLERRGNRINTRLDNRGDHR